MVGIFRDATDDADESVLADSLSDVATLSVSTHSVFSSAALALETLLQYTWATSAKLQLP